MRKIHVIGDSHALFFDFEPFVPHHIGPRLAYKVGEKNRLWSVLSGIPKGQRVMLCCGEVDCRAHICKQAVKQSRSVEDVAKEVADRYFEAILKVKEMGYETIIWHAVHQTPRRVGKGKKYTTYGSFEDRVKATETFNGRLSELAKENGMKVLSVYDKVGEAYTYDHVHLSKKAIPFVLEALKEMEDEN